jgi:hypothetical protein
MCASGALLVLNQMLMDFRENHDAPRSAPAQINAKK